jgi:hypothetical protein
MNILSDYVIVTRYEVLKGTLYVSSPYSTVQVSVIPHSQTLCKRVARTLLLFMIKLTSSGYLGDQIKA